MQAALEMIEREVFLQALVPRVAHSIALWLIRAQRSDRRRKLLDVSILDQHSSFPVFDNFRGAPFICRDYWFLVMHRFEEDNSESFLRAGQHKKIASLVVSAQSSLVNGPQKVHVGRDSKTIRKISMPVQIRSFPYHNVSDVWNSDSYPGKGFDNCVHSLLPFIGRKATN